MKSQLIARLTKQLKVEEQVEESKEPEKQESKVVEEEEPTRVEEDREVSSRSDAGRPLCDAPTPQHSPTGGVFLSPGGGEETAGGGGAPAEGEALCPP